MGPCPLAASHPHTKTDRTITPSPRTLKARWLLPVTTPPIADGTVTVENGRIVAVCKSSGNEPIEDLGNVALLPGLVNAHTHLEFSDLPAPLGRPGMPMVDWIRLVVDRFRRTPQSTGSPVARGLQECVRTGTTTLGEIAQPNWSPLYFDAAPLDATVLLELIAPTADRIAPLLETAASHVRSVDPAGRRWRGLCPHAPFTVLPELLAAAVSLSAEAHVPAAFHLAESREEMQLLESGNGPFRDCAAELCTCDPDLFGHGTRPLDYLRTLAAADRALVIHGNYLDDEEIDFLAKRATRMAVVYCPRTHAYFGHDPYPLEKMLAAGVTVALGTDSRASSPDLSLLAELRSVARQHPDVGRDAILQLGTICGAMALGRDAEVGSIEPGKHANLVAVSLPDRPTADPHELLLDSELPVVATYYRGVQVYPCATQ